MPHALQCLLHAHSLYIHSFKLIFFCGITGHYLGLHAVVYVFIFLYEDLTQELLIMLSLKRTGRLIRIASIAFSIPFRTGLHGLIIV